MTALVGGRRAAAQDRRPPAPRRARSPMRCRPLLRRRDGRLDERPARDQVGGRRSREPSRDLPAIHALGRPQRSDDGRAAGDPRWRADHGAAHGRRVRRGHRRASDPRDRGPRRPRRARSSSAPGSRATAISRSSGISLPGVEVTIVDRHRRPAAGLAADRARDRGDRRGRRRADGAARRRPSTRRRRDHRGVVHGSRPPPVDGRRMAGAGCPGRARRLRDHVRRLGGPEAALFLSTTADSSSPTATPASSMATRTRPRRSARPSWRVRRRRADRTGRRDASRCRARRRRLRRTPSFDGPRRRAGTSCPLNDRARSRGRAAQPLVRSRERAERSAGREVLALGTMPGISAVVIEERIGHRTG